MGSLAESQFVFWVVNNSMDPEERSGGSHWSLLVYSRPENLVAHYDSANGINGNSAEMLYRLLARIITPRKAQTTKSREHSASLIHICTYMQNNNSSSRNSSSRSSLSDQRL
jgi:hypothetical protein